MPPPRTAISISDSTWSIATAPRGVAVNGRPSRWKTQGRIWRARIHEVQARQPAQVIRMLRTAVPRDEVGLGAANVAVAEDVRRCAASHPHPRPPCRSGSHWPSGARSVPDRRPGSAAAPAPHTGAPGCPACRRAGCRAARAARRSCSIPVRPSRPAGGAPGRGSGAPRRSMTCCACLAAARLKPPASTTAQNTFNASSLSMPPSAIIQDHRILYPGWPGFSRRAATPEWRHHSTTGVTIMQAIVLKAFGAPLTRQDIARPAAAPARCWCACTPAASIRWTPKSPPARRAMRKPCCRRCWASTWPAWWTASAPACRRVYAIGSGAQRATIEALGAIFIDRDTPVDDYVRQHAGGDGSTISQSSSQEMGRLLF
ncbi:conserved hypothetical protein [Ricinus communis]|uniref:Uncharacterized protein n=1 Tax=Ricinus communis TaxID=3988 RepID=B9TE53_RICCO|nr:conserved hypothetical protein [Ricinus communis]